MFSIPIVEVAIGLVFIYMYLGMLCTFANEWVARLFDLRSKNLKKGLAQLLNDENMVVQVFNHHLINASAITNKKPSYISSNNFARVLIDIIDSKNENHFKDAENAADLKIALRNADLPAELEKALNGLIDNSHSTINDLRENLQTWFDLSMERISGWYQKRLQTISICIAIVLAFGLNVDTIHIGQTLWQNPVLRFQIADQADIAIQLCKDKNPEDCLAFQKIITNLETLKKIPIGWSEALSPFQWSSWSLSKILGCLISVFAISLGAPFWFNVLDKLNSIRSAGNKPQTADEKKG
jgi:hypothetical protein